jgi:hypothetical protein
MSQDLYFFKQNILDEKEAQEMKQEEVFEKIKTILNKYDVENEFVDLREVFFKEIELPSLFLSYYIPAIEELIDSDEVECIPKESRRFMMNEKAWSALEKIICDQCNSIIIGENKSKSKSKSKNDNECCQKLDKLSMILQDFSTLKELFKRNSLFVNIY